MPTKAQTAANTANAQHSTGPKTEPGKAASSLNHLSHGLTGSTFTVLDWEDQNAFNTLFSRLQSEHQPATVTEELLVEKMAQHYWLTQRAIALQTTASTPRSRLTIRESSSRSICVTRPRTTGPSTRAWTGS
jgi:hypothetical protein